MSNLDIKCKFCDSILNKKKNVVDYENLSNTHGIFYDCERCDVEINFKKFENLYNNQESTNYNFSKNIFYYLKKIILISFLFKFRKILNKREKILDYGCGSGEFSSALSYVFPKSKIFACDLFEIKSDFLSKITKFFNLQKSNFGDYKFDAIILRHVFEHFLNPQEFINNIKKNLNEDGVLLIEVPNKNSVWKKIMKFRWPGYFYPYHYYVFSRLFLKNYFAQQGFRLIKVQNLEPPIFGSFFMTFGLNRSLSRFFSLIIYPIQFLISKLFLTSESFLIVISKK